MVHINLQTDVTYYILAWETCSLVWRNPTLRWELCGTVCHHNHDEQLNRTESECTHTGLRTEGPWVHPPPPEWTRTRHRLNILWHHKLKISIFNTLAPNYPPYLPPPREFEVPVTTTSRCSRLRFTAEQLSFDHEVVRNRTVGPVYPQKKKRKSAINCNYCDAAIDWRFIEFSSSICVISSTAPSMNLQKT